MYIENKARPTCGECYWYTHKYGGGCLCDPPQRAEVVEGNRDEVCSSTDAKNCYCFKPKEEEKLQEIRANVHREP